MSKQLKDSIRRIAEDLWGDWKPEAFDELYTPDFLSHESADDDRDLKEYREWVSGVHTNYAEVRTEIEGMLAEGDQVAARGTLTLRRQTGEEQRRRWCSIFRFEGGKLAEMWQVSCQVE